MATQSLDRSSDRIRPTGRRHRRFFTAASLLLAVFVFIGFAPTYYLRPRTMPAIPFYLHLHGAALTLWFSLLIVQSTLVAAGRRALHRRLGVGGATVGVSIVVLSPFVVIWSMPRFLSSEPIELTAVVFYGDMVAIGTFAALLTMALWMRREPEAHSRLMWLASIPIVAPALGRASIVMAGTPLTGLVMQMSLPLLLVAHDWIMMRRIHRVTIWGSSIVIGTMLFSLMVAGTEWARDLVRVFG